MISIRYFELHFYSWFKSIAFPSSYFILFIYLFFLFPCFTLCSLVQNEQYRAKLKKSNERTLALVKAGMDIVVAVGLLQLAPKKVTPRVTGAFGFVSSLISCYQVIFSAMFHLYFRALMPLSYPYI